MSSTHMGDLADILLAAALQVLTNMVSGALQPMPGPDKHMPYLAAGC